MSRLLAWGEQVSLLSPLAERLGCRQVHCVEGFAAIQSGDIEIICPVGTYDLWSLTSGHPVRLGCKTVEAAVVALRSVQS